MYRAVKSKTLTLLHFLLSKLTFSLKIEFYLQRILKAPMFAMNPTVFCTSVFSKVVLGQDSLPRGIDRRLSLFSAAMAEFQRRSELYTREVPELSSLEAVTSGIKGPHYLGTARPRAFYGEDSGQRQEVELSPLCNKSTFVTTSLLPDTRAETS